MGWSTESTSDSHSIRYDCYDYHSNIRMRFGCTFESGGNTCGCHLQFDWRTGKLHTFKSSHCFSTIKRNLISIADGLAVLCCTNVWCVHGLWSSAGHYARTHFQSEQWYDRRMCDTTNWGIITISSRCNGIFGDNRTHCIMLWLLGSTEWRQSRQYSLKIWICFGIDWIRCGKSETD